MKVWNYAIIMLTMVVFINFLGVTTPGVNELLTTVGINVSSSSGSLEVGDTTSDNYFKYSLQCKNY